MLFSKQFLDIKSKGEKEPSLEYCALLFRIDWGDDETWDPDMDETWDPDMEEDSVSSLEEDVTKEMDTDSDESDADYVPRVCVR